MFLTTRHHQDLQHNFKQSHVEGETSRTKSQVIKRHPWIIFIHIPHNNLSGYSTLSGGSDYSNSKQFLMSSGARIGNQRTSHTALPSLHPKLQVFQLPLAKHRQQKQQHETHPVNFFPFPHGNLRAPWHPWHPPILDLISWVRFPWTFLSTSTQGHSLYLVPAPPLESTGREPWPFANR